MGKKTIGLVVKNHADAVAEADKFEKWLAARQLRVVRRPCFLPDSDARNHQAIPAAVSVVFALGGDGTFLSAVRWIGDREIPILGVKFGRVGFLAEVPEEAMYTAAESVLAGGFKTHSRIRLKAMVIRKGRTVAEKTVLNDVVVNKGTLARLANIRTEINDHYLTTYRADGLIVATPTGSTAYSLAAGGPVIHPGVPGIIMTPICPFTLTNRPLIVPDDARITIGVEEKNENIMITFDGQSGFGLQDTDIVKIEKSLHPVRMIAIPGQNYYDVLKAKLRWSGGRV